MKRQWMKTSPFSNKEVMREKILQEAMTKVKSERTKNIQRLRTGKQNFSELARQILNDTMSVTTSTEAVSFILAPTPPPQLPTVCGEEDEFNENEMLEAQDENETVTMNNAEDSNDEEVLIRFLGSEHHELLMHQIAEAMKHEYGNLEYDGTGYDDTDDYDGGYDWAKEEEVAANTDRYLICPICRSSTMEIDGQIGRCPCGALLNLQNANTGQILSADQLRNLLAAVYDRYINKYFYSVFFFDPDIHDSSYLLSCCDRHLLVCDDITLVDVSYSGLKTAGLYDNEQEVHNHHMKSTMIVDSKEQGGGMSSKKKGGLEFIQREHSDLIAFCSFCGFAERII